jgi:hypothetical protein
MFPVFFSVSSEDIAFAEEIWKRLPDNWVYVYSKTGEEGVHMWDEISRSELPQADLFVIFWSKNYITGKGCVRELQQAVDLVQHGHLRSVVLRLDDFPITWKHELGEAAKPVFEAFLRADLWEHKRNFVNAISEYLHSIDLNKGKESRLERTYRPLVRCILASPRPDFKLAESFALDWIDLRRTVFSLKALARVYLQWKYRGETNARDVPANIDKLYQNAIDDLQSDPGVGSAHFELKAEEAEFSGDFRGALDYMNKAIEADPRFELRSERWRLMAKWGSQEVADRVLKELDEARNNHEYHANWLPFLPMLAETYAIALAAAGRQRGMINTFAPELSGDEIGAIISRAKRSR